MNLKHAGYTPEDVKRAGYTVEDLKHAGYTAEDLKHAGYTAEDLKHAGYTVEVLRQTGYSEKDLKQAYCCEGEPCTSWKPEPGDLVRRSDGAAFTRSGWTLPAGAVATVNYVGVNGDWFDLR